MFLNSTWAQGAVVFGRAKLQKIMKRHQLTLSSLLESYETGIAPLFVSELNELNNSALIVSSAIAQGEDSFLLANSSDEE